MDTNINLIRKVLSNKIVFYLISRYFTYFIQFITSLLIAAKLGPYYLGVWGFLLLIMNYFQQIHFGVANSLNVLLVHHKEDKSLSEKYVNNSLLLVFAISIIAVVVFICIYKSGIETFEKYAVSNYVILISIIIVLQYFNALFVNIYRVKNLIGLVTFSQSIIVLLNFVAVVFFAGDRLILYLVLGNVLGNLLVVLAAIPSKVIPVFKLSDINSKHLHNILKKGIYLFLYNTSNMFIIISIRSFVSSRYSVTEFGLFTFSYSFAHAMLLFMEAISFIIFPKLIDKMSSPNNEEVKSVMNQLTINYVSCSHFLIFSALLLFPVLIYFLPKYQDSIQCLNLVALSILMATYSYGSATMLIAKNKEKISALVAIISLVINCIISFILIDIIQVEYSKVILSSMIAYFVMTMLFNAYAYKYCGFTWEKMLKDNYPLRFMFPYLVAVIICLFKMEYIIVVPIILYVCMNLSDIKMMKESIIKIVGNSKIFNV